MHLGYNGDMGIGKKRQGHWARKRGAVLAFLVLACLAMAVGEDAFRIVVTTDIHYLASSLHDQGGAFQRFASGRDGKDLLHIKALLDSLDRELLAARPALLIVTGDLTSNGEKASHEAMAARFRALEKAGIQVLVLPGNHDINNPWARAFKGESQLVTDSVSPEDFLRIYRDFGPGEALSRDAASLSYIASPRRGLSILMLDSNLYRGNAERGAPATNGRLGPSTLDWIRREEAKARARGDVLFAALHHSLVDHSSVIARGFTLDNAAEVLALFKELGIGLALTGHVHIQDAVQDEASGLCDIATNALSVWPHQYGILTFGPDRVLRYRTRVLDVEAWARATGNTDPYLLGYAKESEAAFRQASALMGSAILGQDRAGSAEAGLASQTMATLNLRYFAGRQEENSRDILGSEGLALLEEAPSPFVAAYALSILRDNSLDDNRVDIMPRD